MILLQARPAFLGVEEWTEASFDGSEELCVAQIIAADLVRLGWEVILDGETVGDEE